MPKTATSANAPANAVLLSRDLMWAILSMPYSRGASVDAVAS
ncbi:hypothetical protein CZ674_11840 [Agrococcus casei LMG 22410]|uniref:Uncharacterized protein n=1 Tax=Agrococcus casei LMG 22410 TaxID=1255656 RepID=A0A1R4GGX0_9MICO|nr:hypothetical protein CZ674_11840 [Agrococcus casei LMG 22410]